MKRSIDQFDLEAEAEANAIKANRKNTVRPPKPHYGTNHHKKVTKWYMQDIKDAEITWEYLVNMDGELCRDKPFLIEPL